MIPVYKPYLPDYITKFAHDAIDSTWISSNGDYLNKIIEKFKDLFGYKYILLTNNGTTAGHLMSIGLNYKYNTTNIIVPNNAYVAAWNVFKMNPIYNFNIIDANINTWNADYEKYLENNPENNTILIVHNINSLVNLPYLKNKYPNNIFVEDNCEGFLGKYENKYSGSESEISIISFFGNKNITSGEGGAVMFSDENLFNFLNSVRCQGMTNEKFIFDKLGYNYRMTNIQAALIYGQLLHLNEIVELKKEVFSNYYQNLKDEENIIFQKSPDNTKQSNWMYGIRIKDCDINKLRNIELNLYENGIETRKMFPPITYHKHFKNENSDITNAKLLYESCLILPSYPELNKFQINKICDILKSSIKNVH